jgi:hypothetical protein
LDLPGFFVVLAILVEILVVFVELGILVKFFIFKDFVVFFVVVLKPETGIHGEACAENYSAVGLAAAGGAAAAAPG